ncbi:MAG: hypothetical protein ACE5EX_02205, partial [Phycisphaerae bacterium]
MPVGTSPAAPRIEVPAELKDQPARWLTSWKQKVEEQLSFLTAAYDLDVDMQQVVRDELLMRWRLQADYEETELKKIPDAPVPGKGDEDEQNAEAMRLLFAFYDHMPLNEERVVEWLEATLPPDVAAAGRPRWNELIQRRERKRRAKEADIRRRSGEKRLIIRARASRRAALSDRGKPMPAGRAPAAANTDGAREAAIVRPARGLFERPPKEGAAAASNDRLPPMPPVEDWYRHLFRFADEHHFNNRQLAAAKAMVEDLARRADEY